MSVETHRVLIGTYGWKHQAWENAFYDEDLPKEWQLGFYSNEFPVVIVPAADWLDVADLDEWAEEVSDNFRFIFEIPADIVNDNEQFKVALAKVKKLGDFCLGLVFQLNQDSLVKIEILKEHVQLATEFLYVCLDMKGLKLTGELKESLQENNISLVWDGISADTESLTQGSLALTHVIADDLDMQGLRKVVEVSLSASNENCISVLCVDGNPPSVEKIRNADTILNLL